MLIQQRLTFKADEKLKSKKLIEQLFKGGKSFSLLPFRIIYSQLENGTAHLQCGFSASTKKFKKAVERNRIKRLMREAYRLQKLPLKNELEENDKYLAVFIIYTGNDMPSYDYIFKKTGNVLAALEKIIRVKSSDKKV